MHLEGLTGGATIAAAPIGFDDEAPNTVVVVDVEEGGRLLAWLGDTIPVDDLEIGMDVQVVPRVFEDIEPSWHPPPDGCRTGGRRGPGRNLPGSLQGSPEG